MRSLIAFPFLAAAVPVLSAQTVAAPFNSVYSITNVGAIPGLPSNWGGIVFDRNDPNVLLCTRWDTVGIQNLHAVRVVRDAQGHITGFSGTATPTGAQLDYIDGGLDYHEPTGVMFYARYTPAQGIGQLKPGSTLPDRIDGVLPINYLGGLKIVPDGLPGAGQLKTLRWPGGQWTSATLSPDANGTFDILGETQTATLIGGPDGFCYVPPMAPLFTGADVLVAEFNTGKIAAYQIDGNGDPIPSTRQDLVTGLGSCFVMAVDPVTLDVVHAGWSGTTVRVIKGFNLNCGQCNTYGIGLAGTGGLVPELTFLGCPLANQTTGIHVGNAIPNGLGLLAAGFVQLSFPIFGGTLLNEAAIVLGHITDPAGHYELTFVVDPTWAGAPLYMQTLYLDPNTPEGFSMSNGVAMPFL